jgi:predicted O-methyltransferase YrrM
MSDFPDLLPAFPHTAEFVVNGKPTRHDVDFQPSCGYVSIDEARILWQAARDFPGVWCEIGSHTGFSGAHIAHGLFGSGGLVAIEPQFVYLDFFQRARSNWQRADHVAQFPIDGTIFPVAALSKDYFAGCVETFAGGFIDGDHSPGEPLHDARMLLPRLAERAVVIFHDGSGQPVHEAAAFMRHQGFEVRAYPTMGSLMVCWRGEWEAPEIA